MEQNDKKQENIAVALELFEKLEEKEQRLYLVRLCETATEEQLRKIRKAIERMGY